MPLKTPCKYLRAPLFRAFGGLCFALLSVGCTPDETPLTCPLAKQPTKSPAFGVHFVKRGTEPAVVVTSNEGMACYLLEANGQLGEQFCKVRYWEDDPNNLRPFAMMRRAVILDDKVAYYSSRFVVRADFNTDHAAVTMLSFDVGGKDAQLTHLFEQPDGLFGIWTRENINGTTTAGLAQIGSDDVVRAIGAPFFNGLALSNVIEGGWGISHLDAVFDAENDHFLIDNLDDVNLVELDRQGNVLASTQHGKSTSAGHLGEWTKLGNGDWVGLNGGWLCHFDPWDRTMESCVRVEVADVPVTDSDIMELNVDSNGDLWGWIRVFANQQGSVSGIVLGRFDGIDRFEGPVFQLTLDTCEELIGFD